MHIIIEIIKFTEYCNAFYNIDYGLYPIASNEQIDKAIFIYMTEPRTLKIDFDSIDRENVRAIIEYSFINKNVDNLSITKLG